MTGSCLALAFSRRVMPRVVVAQALELVVRGFEVLVGHQQHGGALLELDLGDLGALLVDDPRLENLQASYTMIEEPDEEVEISRREKSKAKQEPVIKGVLPDQPAPVVAPPAPAPEPVAAAPVAANKNGGAHMDPTCHSLSLFFLILTPLLSSQPWNQLAFLLFLARSRQAA